VEAGWCESGRNSLTAQLLLIVCLSFGLRYIAQWRQQAMVVKPGHPFQRGQFDGLTRLPGSAAMDQLSFVEAVDGLGQGVDAPMSRNFRRRLQIRQNVGV